GIAVRNLPFNNVEEPFSISSSKTCFFIFLKNITAQKVWFYAICPDIRLFDRSFLELTKKLNRVAIFCDSCKQTFGDNSQTR
ncbi:MAG: hypothetical protein JSV38_12425, partial [Desulfobacterales bacterium]